MLEMGIICLFISFWVVFVVIVLKFDGIIRLCVDYRKLNFVIKMDVYLIFLMEKMIDKIVFVKYISIIDLIKGYW